MVFVFATCCIDKELSAVTTHLRPNDATLWPQIYKHMGMYIKHLQIGYMSPSRTDPVYKHANKPIRYHPYAWWRHQMETFSALLAICAGNSPATGEFPAQRPVTRSFDVFFDLRLNIRLSKQSWGWWFQTLSRPLWRHCNDDWICRSTSRCKPSAGTVLTTKIDIIFVGR